MWSRVISKRSSARIISTVLHPFVIAGAMWIFIPLQTSLTGWPLIRAMVLGYLFCLGMPVAYLAVQKRRGKIDDLDIRQRERRNCHYLTFEVIYALQFITFLILKSPNYLLAFTFAYVFNTAIYAGINRVWKISIHGAGVGGPTGVLLYLAPALGWWFILTFPFIVWSRVALKHHSAAQVIAGLSLGMILVYLEFWTFSQGLNGLFPAG